MKSLKRTVGLLTAMTSFGAASVIALGALVGTPMSPKDEKLCADLAQIEHTVQGLNNLGPQSAVQDAKSLTAQATSTGKQIERQARTDRYALRLAQAIDDLEHSVKDLPPSGTLGSAQPSISNRAGGVKIAADNFQATRCPSRPIQ